MRGRVKSAWSIEAQRRPNRPRPTTPTVAGRALLITGASVRAHRGTTRRGTSARTMRQRPGRRYGHCCMATPAERETTDRSVRDTARQEMPRTLREEVRLAGDALGQVIAEHGGADLLADVETLRRTVINARAEDGTRGGLADAADKLVSSWSLDRAEQVARAFTCYFHLVNLAEERYRARALREADYGASGPAEALAAALAAVRTELGDAGLEEQLATLRVHPVFTAHPTEARRRAVTSALQRVGEQLELLADPRGGGSGATRDEAPSPRRDRRPLAYRSVAEPGTAAARRGPHADGRLRHYAVPARAGGLP